MRALSLIAVYVSLALAACGTEEEEPDLDADEPGEVRPIAPPERGVLPAEGPLAAVPPKVVGSPLHVGSSPIVFTDVTEQHGLPIETGNSVSFVDFDDDSWPDLTVVADNGLAFYRNIGGGFEDVTFRLLLTTQDTLAEAGHLVYADVDDDGDLDLYLASPSSADRILLNNGYGQFKPPAADVGLGHVTDVQGVSFADVDLDGDLDVYVTRGRRADAEGKEASVAGFQGAPNVLLLNQGGVTFQDATLAWIAAAGDTSETFGALFADYDRDGDPDALVVRDFLSDHYLRNLDGEQFERADGVISSAKTALMGLAVGDYDGDAVLDVYGTDFGADILYRGMGDGTFENVYLDVLDSVDGTSNMSGWGVAFVDLDNDGDQDIISVASYDSHDTFRADADRVGGWWVLENTGNGRFRDVTEAAGLGGVVNGHSLAIGDFDLDGDIDVAVALAPPIDLPFGPDPATVPRGIRLLRNDSARAAGNHFLEVSLRSSDSNRFAIGAIIDVEAGSARASRVVTAGDSYLATHSLVQHFGLGAKSVADRVTITWPGGAKTVAHQVPAGYARLAMHDGPCCFEGKDCGEPWVTCPTWVPPATWCTDRPCSPCAAVCSRLSDCGEVRFDCHAECEKRAPEGQIVTCALAADCPGVMACFTQL